MRELGAERLVDLATLTGAVLVALGSTYAALISNDDDWAAAVERAASESGELAWRLPLHPEYKQLTKGTVADLTNASAKRKAGTIYAGSFLEEFVDERPLGPPRHRRHRLGHRPRVRRQGRDRLRRPAARPARPSTSPLIRLGSRTAVPKGSAAARSIGGAWEPRRTHEGVSDGAPQSTGAAAAEPTRDGCPWRQLRRRRLDSEAAGREAAADGARRRATQSWLIVFCSDSHDLERARSRSPFRVRRRPS